MPTNSKFLDVVDLPVPPRAAAMSASAALAQCAAIVVAEPAVAAELAAIEQADRFLHALALLARARGVAIDPQFDDAFKSNRHVAMEHRIANWPLQARRGWQPFAIEWGPLGAELVWGCGVARTGAPFHEEIVAVLRARPLNRLVSVRTPLTPEFVAELRAEALPVGGLIFHMSRCGSTLVAQALKAWPGVRVLSEPALLDSAITIACSGHDPQWQIFHAVLAALAQPEGQDRQLLIKLDAWHALALAAICAKMPVPWMFIYRDPVEVLASHAREPGRHTVPGMLPETWLGEPATSATMPSLTEHAARVIGAICAAIEPHARAGQLLNYAELPQALTSRLAACFDLDSGAADRAQLDALLAHHAKRPYELFRDDRAAKHDAAGPGLRAAARRWIEPHYRALERVRCGEGR